jgi:hypothetical protein
MSQQCHYRSDDSECNHHAAETLTASQARPQYISDIKSYKKRDPKARKQSSSFERVLRDA